MVQGRWLREGIARLHASFILLLKGFQKSENTLPLAKVLSSILSHIKPFYDPFDTRFRKLYFTLFFRLLRGNTEWADTRFSA